MKLHLKYREVCSVQIVAGNTALFWSDTWNGYNLQSGFLRLFSFSLDKNLSHKDVLETENILQLFYLPLS